MDSAIDRAQVFELIDQVLPFEACLYHEFLPLALHQSELCLGMVNLTDSAALEYARRIVAFLGYRLVTRNMPAPIHKLFLSTYLSQKPQTPGYAQDSLNTTDSGGKDPDHPDHAVVDTPTFLLENVAGLPADAAGPEDEQYAEGNVLLAEPAVAQPGTPDLVAQPSASQQLPALTNNTLDLKTHIQPTPPFPRPEPTPITPITPVKLSIPGESLPQLEMSPQPVSTFRPQLHTLPVPELTQALLIRILDSGVGRLYFERQGEVGQVFWSKNGKVEAVLLDLPAQRFQAVIDELKTLVSMSCAATNQPTIAEVERLYQKQRILLRLQILPRFDGEDATLQVLRGSALKFHQQHQLTALSRDAIQIARQLHQKVNELQVQTQSMQTFQSSTASLFLEIDQVIYRMEEEMDCLRQLKASLRVRQKQSP
jgi:type II secretory ATPase GspE/PulE/Tfp pilus assembly ATPase PilB-like protein